MIRVTGGCALERMREGARRSRVTRNRTYFLIQTLMNPSLAPLRAVRRALDVSVLVIAFQSRVTRLRPFRLACSASCASPSARVARALEKGIKRRADAIRYLIDRKRVAKRERFRPTASSASRSCRYLRSS